MAVLRTMYPPQKDSPSTFLLGDISATDVLVMVASAALLPQVFPYPLTIGIDRSITETVMVTACNLENNQLTIIRGSNAISWTAGVKVGRVFRAQDLEDIQENIKVISAESEQVAELIPELETTIADNTEAIASTTADLTTEVARAKKAESDEATRADTEEKRIDAAKPERSELVQVITGCECDAVNDEVTLEFTRYNSVTKQVSTFAKMLPIVTGQSAGLMSVGMYDIIGDLRDDVEGKLDKPTSTTSGNLATFDASGEVTDSGKKASDFATATDLTAHTGNTANPHGVTKAQVGLGNVPNVATNDQTPTYSQASAIANLTSGEKLSVAFGKIMKAIADFIAHKNSTGNPHGVTASQAGAAPAVHGHDWGAVTGKPAAMPASDVYPWAKAPTKPGYTAAEVGAAGQPIKLTASVPVASWALSGACYQQTVAVAGLLASDDLHNAEILPVGNQADPVAQALTDEAYGVMAGPGGGAWCNVNGQLLLRCPPGNTKPAVNFNIAVAIVR